MAVDTAQVVMEAVTVEVTEAAALLPLPLVEDKRIKPHLYIQRIQ